MYTSSVQLDSLQPASHAGRDWHMQRLQQPFSSSRMKSQQKKHRLRIRSQHTPLQVVVKFVQRVAGSLLQSVQSILVLVVRLSPLDLQLNGLPGACWGHLETWRKQST